MIDEDRTMQLYGYTSNELKPKARSMIVAVCDECGKYRDLPKFNYHELCRSCAKIGEKNPMFGKLVSEETRRKQSVSRLGEKHWAFGTHPSEETRLRMSESHIGKHNGCSGENHYLWKGGITPWRKMLYYSREYQEWRRTVFERDGFTCRECGHSGDDLRAHHILPIRDWKDPQFSLNPANGITLCDDCHRDTFGREYEFFARFFDMVNEIELLN